MSKAAVEIIPNEASDSSDLIGAIERSLKDVFGVGRQAIRIERQPSPYRSSFNLEDITVFLDNGESVNIIFKDLSWNTILEGGKRLKPEFIYNPQREIDVYLKVLTKGSFGTAKLYGYDIDPENGRYWLILEKVPGRELYQVGELEKWIKVARWLARFHGYFVDKTGTLSSDVSLLKYDESFYREWMHRAKNYHSSTDNESRQLERLSKQYERVTKRLLDMRQTFIHGEFYASNILVSAEERICPIDWERSGVGPPLIDLAALVTGWGQDEAMAIAKGYYSSLLTSQQGFSSEEAFFEALKCCQFYLAIQWIGWFGRRAPFVSHARNWFSEAVKIADDLSL
jgi:aminoglycoside phosphotransferase